MEKIPLTSDSPRVANALNAGKGLRDKFFTGFFENIGVIVAAVMTAIVVMIMSTKITVNSDISFTDHLILSAVLAIYYITMFFTSKDSGRKMGLRCTEYSTSLNHFEDLRRKVVDLHILSDLKDYCFRFVQRELRDARENALIGVGITYERYEAEYLGKNVDEISGLSVEAKKAIKKANAMKPIVLRADDVFAKDGDAKRGEALGKNPKKKDSLISVRKVIRSVVISFVTGVIALQFNAGFSYALIVTILLDILPGIINSFFGYTRGYYGITVDLVNYMDRKSDILEDFINEHAKIEKAG